jgi:hypothetical protein
MEQSTQFDRALYLCGFPLLQAPPAYRQRGADAWHNAYLVRLRERSWAVTLLRQSVIYERQEGFDERAPHEDYAEAGTIESYMGEPLAALTPDTVCEYGQQLGRFVRAMHAHRRSIVGFGSLRWHAGAVVGQQTPDLAAIWQAEIVRIQEHLEQLAASPLEFDRATVRRAVVDALEQRRCADEPVALVNRDVTPKNMLATAQGWAALADPVPLLGHPVRYASFFGFCYTFLLPALSDAPRYARHRLSWHAWIIAMIADGYVEGHTDDPTLKHALAWSICSGCSDGRTTVTSW